MNATAPPVAIGGHLPPIRWIIPKIPHKTYHELKQEGIISPYFRFRQWVDLGDLSITYLMTKGKVEQVKHTHIIPSQPTVQKRVVAYYLSRTRLTDEWGNLPFGIRFADSPNVYLTDGHHRFEASKRKGRTHLRMRVETYPISLHDAMKGHPK